MQVAREAQALAGHGQARELGAGLVQLLHQRPQPGQAVDDETDHRGQVRDVDGLRRHAGEPVLDEPGDQRDHAEHRPARERAQDEQRVTGQEARHAGPAIAVEREGRQRHGRLREQRRAAPPAAHVRARVAEEPQLQGHHHGQAERGRRDVAERRARGHHVLEGVHDEAGEHHRDDEERQPGGEPRRPAPGVVSPRRHGAEASCHNMLPCDEWRTASSERNATGCPSGLPLVFSLPYMGINPVLVPRDLVEGAAVGRGGAPSGTPPAGCPGDSSRGGETRGQREEPLSGSDHT